jgi:hypothetical protein
MIAAMSRDPLPRLRRICLALPETTERLSHGEPTWFIRDKKTFVMYSDHHHGDRLGFWCAAAEGVLSEVVAAEPDMFYVPPYVGTRGWLGVRLDITIDWGRVEDLVDDAYRVIAPKVLLATLDDRAAQR